MLTVAPNSLDLKELNVGGVVYVTDASIQEVAERCRHLHRLDISRTRVTVGRVNGTGLRAVAKHCRQLVLIDMCAMLVLRNTRMAVVSKLPRLRHLDTSCWASVGDKVLLMLADKYPDLRHLSFSEDVSVSFPISKGGIIAQVEACVQLQHLHIITSKGMLDAGLAAIAQYWAPRLRRLNLARNARVTEASRRFVGERYWARELEELTSDSLSTRLTGATA
eukprot:jgi/Mesvir1/17874/Mv12950-RA.1